MEKRTFWESNSNPTQKAVAMVTPKVSGAGFFLFFFFFFFSFWQEVFVQGELGWPKIEWALGPNTLVAARATTQGWAKVGRVWDSKEGASLLLSGKGTANWASQADNNCTEPTRPAVTVSSTFWALGGYYTELFASLNAYISVRKEVFFPCYRWGNWGSRNLRHLPDLTANDGAGIPAQVAWTLKSREGMWAAFSN